VDGFQIPSYIDGDTLAFVVSYSGNTWETLEAFNTLLERHVPTVVVSHGGEISELANEKNIPRMIVPESATPRSALGIFLGMILGLLDLLGVLKGKKILESFQKHLGIYLTKMREESYYDEFLKLAEKRDFFHVWGASGDSCEFAYRAQTQFNENSKVRAVFSSFTECCHNLLVGFSSKGDPLVLVLSTDYLPPKYEIALECVMDP